MRRLVLLGQAPSATAGRARAFDGASGARLSGLIGRPLHEVVDAVNLLRRWPGKNGKGDAFPRTSARRAAVRLASRLRGRRVVFAGRAVAKAFDVPRRCSSHPHVTDCLGWHWSRYGFLYAVLPHPSAVNRWWNDPKNVARARRFLRAAVAGKDLR